MIRIFDQELAATKIYFDGTHRTRSPEATLAQWMPLMGALGITRLANITGLDHIGIPVFLSVRPNSRSISVSQGKGLVPAAAKASALLESIEGWHAENMTHRLRYERRASLARSCAAVDVEALPLLRADSDLARPFSWVEGWDLLQSEPCWVPFEAVSTDFVLQPNYAPTFLMSSNGLASGNHLLEAITHALTELIERDALAAWSQAPNEERDARRLDLESIDDPHCRELLRRIAGAGFRVFAWHVPSRFRLPVFECVIADPQPRIGVPQNAPGSGCHLTASVALSRAITEAAQTRLTYISGSRDDLEPPSPRRSDPQPAHGSLAFTRALDCATASFEGDVRVLLDALRAAAIERAVVVDLTRAELQIPVVKVIVPGLGFNEALSVRGRAAATRRGGATE